MNHADRLSGYLRNGAGARRYPLGSEGSLTAAQRRRANHKLNHRKARALRRNRAHANKEAS